MLKPRAGTGSGKRERQEVDDGGAKPIAEIHHMESTGPENRTAMLGAGLGESIQSRFVHPKRRRAGS